MHRNHERRAGADVRVVGHDKQLAVACPQLADQPLEQHPGIDIDKPVPHSDESPRAGRPHDCLPGILPPEVNHSCVVTSQCDVLLIQRVGEFQQLADRSWFKRRQTPAAQDGWCDPPGNCKQTSNHSTDLQPAQQAGDHGNDI